MTVFHDGQFWVGVVEEVVNGKLRAGRYLFGSEPKDQEVLEFVNTKLLEFMSGLSEHLSVEKRQPRKINPKRLARQAAREMKANGVSTYAQAALQLEYEKRKKEKQILSKARREELKEYKRELKRKKAKEKHRGR
nr:MULTISPECIES: YjdF family protein [unclassified Brevibacillus]